MAIWQVSMYLVDRDKHLDCKTENFNKSLSVLMAYFPEIKSWSKSSRVFGDFESTCIEVDCYEEQSDECADYDGAYDLGEYKGDEISLRIDITKITREEITAICKFADINNLIVHYKCNIYEPTVENFKYIILNSEAKRFITDPHNYLNELGG